MLSQSLDLDGTTAGALLRLPGGRDVIPRGIYVPYRPRGDTCIVSRLPNVCLVLITPDSSEIRWVLAAPKPGAKVPGRFHGTWLVVDEVFQSGALTYTVFASRAPQGMLEQAREVAGDAVERVQESVSPAMRPSFEQRRTGHHLQ